MLQSLTSTIVIIGLSLTLRFIILWQSGNSDGNGGSMTMMMIIQVF